MSASGAETPELAIKLINELIQLLRSADFELRKRASNSSDIIQHIPNEYHNQNTTCLFNADESIKALGLIWSPIDDKFGFNINFSFSSNQCTKRTTLSTIARLFDPLGWINPVVTKAKLFLNKLWDRNLYWDDPLSSDLQSEWSEIVEEFQFLHQIEIPRWLNTNSRNKRNEIHIFCDSSQRAYGTVAYLRTIDSNNVISIALLIAKNKLTPVRKPLTIPRAELCGAVLAVKLYESLQTKFRLPINQIFMWTDSSIVLSWRSKSLDTICL